MYYRMTVSLTKVRRRVDDAEGTTARISVKLLYLQ